MKLFAYPLTSNDGGKTLTVNSSCITFFTEEVFIDPESEHVEAASKPVVFLSYTDFRSLFGEIPDLNGLEITTITD